MQISFDESLLAHEQIFGQFRGLHTGERYPYERGNVRNMQAVVTMAHLIERGFRDGEAQAAAESEPAPLAFGSQPLGATPQCPD